VWEAAKAVKIPIIGLGGIETVDDVLEYLSVGAKAVQVGTASFVRPGAIEDLTSQLESRATGFNVQNIQGLTEVLVPKLD
jgi:dihydroorotate dehydrogenase (NAD+) catalytic subunit